MIDMNERNAAADLAAQIEALDALAADFARLAKGTYPSASEFASAPTLYKPLRISRPEPCLRGYDAAHDRVWTTGRLLLWAPGRGWARTTEGLWKIEGEGQ